MKIDYEQIRQDIEKALNDTILTNNAENFKSDLFNYLNELQSEGYIQPEPKLENVKVTDNGDGEFSIDLMRAFKNFPKEKQEEIYCEMTGLNKNDVSEFIYNKEGYIKGFKPKKAMEYISINITVGE